MNKELAEIVCEFHKTGSTIYHTGFLSTDRAKYRQDKYGTHIITDKADVADKLGNYFLNLAEHKEAHLFQKQIMAGDENKYPVYEYHARRAL